MRDAAGDEALAVDYQLAPRTYVPGDSLCHLSGNVDTHAPAQSR